MVRNPIAHSSLYTILDNTVNSHKHTSISTAPEACVVLRNVCLSGDDARITFNSEK